ncbi:MAG: hypothetical protein KGD70_12505 [Candidatus Lokiarchaeota archaeon]|nr:hypothetical protein [Candidatus Lokiarchaeota archaeon]
MEKINLELFKKYFWLISLVSALLGIISVFVPAWGGIEGSNLISVWYWGFYFITGWGSLDEPAITIPGVVVAILLLLGTALIFYSALSAKRKNEPKTKLSLIGGILFLVAPSLFMITMAGLQDTFWLEYFAGIGLILPYIGGIITILAWYSMRR